MTGKLISNLGKIQSSRGAGLSLINHLADLLVGLKTIWTYSSLKIMSTPRAPDESSVEMRHGIKPEAQCKGQGQLTVQNSKPIIEALTIITIFH